MTAAAAAAVILGWLLAGTVLGWLLARSQRRQLAEREAVADRWAASLDRRWRELHAREQALLMAEAPGGRAGTWGS